MRFLNIKVLLISSIIIGTVLSSCKNKYGVESAAIDSLITKNKRALEFLQIDLVTINERKNEMKGQLAVLKKFKPDTSGAEFAMNLDKFEGIFKTYKRFIENYEVIFNRVRFNEKQLSGLKNSLLDGKISAFDYKLALAKETNRVNENLANAEIFGRRIFQLEPDYQRLSSYFDPQVRALIKKYPELKPVLEENSK